MSKGGNEGRCVENIGRKNEGISGRQRPLSKVINQWRSGSHDITQLTRMAFVFFNGYVVLKLIVHGHLSSYGSVNV